MARLSKLRGNESYRRRQGRKTPRSITLIVCEGETEQEYFEAARIKYGLTTAEVILAENTRGPAPISVVECAEGKCGEPGGYDQIFCVFDRDGHESFDRAREKIKALSGRKKKPLPINEAISVPCFELWVLLHFEKTDAPYDKCVEVNNRVRTHMPGYEKADAAIAKQLMARLEVAIENADWLECRAETNNFNPFTSVHKVFQHFATVGQ
ncbi:MAG: RloB family protein [Candidatus Nitrotoga sp.]